MILTLNAGSSSLKFALFQAASQKPVRHCSGQVSAIGGQSQLTVYAGNGTCLIQQATAAPDPAKALEQVLGWCHKQLGDQPLLAAGHRVVHGGIEFTRPIRLDADSLARLHRLVPLAPLHQPHNLAAIESLSREYPDLPQFACFDTAFHHSQPAVARRYALPRELHDAGIQSYGFHGLSCEYIHAVLPDYLGDQACGRVVIAHLGNGASLTALKHGRSIATTMGFTPLDGLVMGSRCGSIDPGVLIHLLRHQHLDADGLEDLLFRRSGLLGVSGISSDMAVLLQSTSPSARQAVELFVYRISRQLGSLTAALGGLDALIFSGGIGEHAATIRAAVLDQAAWLGVELDTEANNQLQGNGCITTLHSPTTAWVIDTDEEQVIAEHCWRLLQDV